MKNSFRVVYLIDHERHKTKQKDNFCLTHSVNSSFLNFEKIILKKMTLDYDYIVIGAGINGSWVGYHLAKLSKNVLVIEQVSIEVVPS
jgi:ribulose 1,5-bisphosphate synthetase/thiazole synthase